MNKQAAQVRVAPLADAMQCQLAAGVSLPWTKPIRPRTRGLDRNVLASPKVATAASQVVALGDPELHELLSHPAKRKHRLLRFGLHRDRFAWLLHREPDRSCIGNVVLVPDVA